MKTYVNFEDKIIRLDDIQTVEKDNSYNGFSFSLLIRYFNQKEPIQITFKRGKEARDECFKRILEELHKMDTDKN